MGDTNKLKKGVLALASEEVMVAHMMGGRMHVRWDETAQATPHGQLVFFADFLATSGVFERWVDACPLNYTSPTASTKRDVLGTLMLGILAGSKRYAHIAGVRGDAVAAHALGLKGLVSEDSVRRALKAMAPESSQAWMRTALMEQRAQRAGSALGAGRRRHDQAAVWPPGRRRAGLQPAHAGTTKPGRTSHVLHTFWVDNLRLVLDAVLTSGKQHSSGHAKAALGQLLDDLGDKASALVPGDCGYGNEDIIKVCEQRGQPYLVRLTQDGQRQAADRAAVWP